jgi:PAS domain S-box-containing protein
MRAAARRPTGPAACIMRMSTTTDLYPPLTLAEMPAPLLRALVEAGGTLGQALTDANGRIVWLSAGFERSCGAGSSLVGQPVAAVFGHAEDDDLRWLGRPPGPHGETHTLRCWRGPWARRWLRVGYRALDAEAGARAHGLVTIDPASGAAAPGRATSEAAPDDLVRLTLLLEVAQKFGGLGVWDHDPRTGTGHWDRHVWRFFGIDADADTPSPELALTRVHPQDVEQLTDVYAPVRPGGYTRRFRVVHRDGSVHRLQAQFIVEGDARGAPSRVFGVMRDDTQASEASESLHIAHEQLQLALDLANLAIWRHELRTDKLVQSEQAWRMLGLAPPPGEAPTATAVAQYAHPDDLQRLVDSARMARRTGLPHETTARFRRADGSWCHTLVRRVLQRDEAGQPVAFLGVTLDITAQIEESHRVLQSEHRLALATEAAAVAMWEADLGDGRITWNRQMYLLHGVAPGQPLPDFDDWVRKHVHPDDREPVLAQGRRLLQQRRGSMETQCRVVRSDGTLRWVMHRCHVEPRGDGSVMLGIMTDVTAVVEAQARLAAANERAALATRCAGIGTWEHDLVTGEAVWDEQMFLLRGLAPRPQALSRDERLALVHPDDVAAMEAQLHAATTTGAACNYGFRVRLPDGRWRPLASRSVVLRDKQGRLTRQVGVNWETTEDGGPS